jgi:endo-1,4-beta-D-glucanase Y
VLACVANDRARFDAMRTYVMSVMRRGSDGQTVNGAVNDGMLRWRMRASTGQVWDANGNTTAPDGDIWVITAFLMGEALGWGSGGDANALLGSLSANLTHYFSNNVVRFYRDANVSDPSYANPAFFQYWANKRGGSWGNLVAPHRAHLQANLDKTGGWPSYLSNFDGSQNQAYNPDSPRVMMNMALDYAWNGITSHKSRADAYLNNLPNAGNAYERAMLATGGNGVATECKTLNHNNWLYFGALDTSYYSGLLSVIGCSILSGQLRKF